MSLLRKLLLFSLVLFVFFASLLLYVQTRHGFRHAVVPLAAKLTGAKLEVQDGWLSLLGALEVDGLVYEDPASGISFDAERIALRARPWSFIEEGVPRIDDLELKGANLRIALRPGPVEAPVQEPEGESSETFHLIPVAIERARFEDVTVTVDQGDRRITGQVAAALDRLGPGRKGSITLQTGMLLERGAGTQDLSGSMDLTLAVDVGPGGTPIKWDGASRVLARIGRGSLESTDPEVINLEQILTGEYEHAAQSLRAASNVAISRAGTSLGTVELTASREGAKRPAVTDVSLNVEGVTGDLVNRFLRETAATQVQAGKFDAKIKVQVEGTRTSVRGDVLGSGVRLRLADREASPPVDVSLRQVGSFDSATTDLAIETFTLTIGDRAKTLLSGALDRPVLLHLDRTKGKTSSADTGAAPAVWSLRLSPSEIRELRPWLALSGGGPLTEVAAGTFGGALVVSMYEQGAIVDVAGRLEATDVMLQGEGRGRAGLMGPLGVVAEVKSRLTGMQLLKLDPLTANVSLKGKPVAALHATGAWRFADPTGLTALKSTVTLTGLPGETLNPLLSLWSETRIGRAKIDGHADVAVNNDHARWVVDISGEEIQLRLPEAATDMPPLDLLIKQAGEFDRAEQQLRLDRLSIQLVERRRPVVTLSLDKPLSLSFAQAKKGDGSQAGGSAEPITLGLRVNRLGLHQLRPWVVLAGSQALASVRGGALDADLQVHISGTDDAAVAGRLDLEDVTFERGASASVTLGTEVRASVVGRSRVTVDSWAVRALAGKTVLGEARLTGSADFGGATDLRLDLAASDLSEFVGRLGLLTERRQELISGGTLKGDVRLVTAGPAKPVTVKAALRSTDLIMRLNKTQQLTRSLGLQADIEVDADRTLAQLQRLEVSVESAGAKAGILTANGRWPLADTGSTTPAGAVSVTVKEWDSGPFVDFFGILPGRVSGPLPLTGELIVSQEAGGKVLAVKGKETIGPVTAAVNGGAPESATIQLEQDMARSGDEIRVAVLSLTAERPKGRADRAAMNGNLRMGAQPRLQLRGSVDAFNADWYAALTAPPSDQASIGKTSGKSNDAKDTGVGLGVPLDLDVDLAIGSVIYQTLEIGKGRLVAKGDGQKMQATLEPTGLAGGSVQGTVTIALKGGQPDIGWDAKGEALDLGVLTKAASGEPEPRMTGRGTFTTSGTGRGQGEALRQSLSGTVAFDVADGQFVKSPLLEFLAKQTHIDEFRALGFRTVHGELQIKDGWVHLNQARVVGQAAALEAGGKIGLDGRLDVYVEPKIGPTISDHVTIPCLNQLTKTADGFTVLPVAVTVQGTAEKPAYGVQMTGGNMVGRQVGALVGTVADLLTGCQGGAAAQKATEEALGAINDTAKDLIKDLFGGKKKR